MNWNLISNTSSSGYKNVADHLQTSHGFETVWESLEPLQRSGAFNNYSLKPVKD